MKGRLNLFQAAMLRWRALHPYNAVHVVHVRQPLERRGSKRRFASQLEALGLTGLDLDARRRSYRMDGWPRDTGIAGHCCGR